MARFRLFTLATLLCRRCQHTSTENIKKSEVPLLKLLKVGIVGAPNHGKSSLFNGLIDWNVASVSSKAHTTQHIVRGILTEKDTQLVFIDTPGVINSTRAKRHRLDEKFQQAPMDGLQEADVVLVVTDAHDRGIGNGLDLDLFRTLHLANLREKTTALVFTKIDLVRNKSALLQHVHVLTGGYIEGKKKSRVMKQSPSTKLMDPLQFKSSEILDLLDIPEQTDDFHDTSLENIASLKYKIQGHQVNDRIVNIMKNSKQRWLNTKPENNEEGRDIDPKLFEVAMKLKTRRLWPFFKRIFFIDNLNRDGTSELKEFLLSEAKECSEWPFCENVITDMDPETIAIEKVREQCLENLPHSIPFLLKYEITRWDAVEEDTLAIRMRLISSKKYFTKVVYGHNGFLLEQIRQAAEKSIKESFNRNVTLALTSELETTSQL